MLLWQQQRSTAAMNQIVAPPFINKVKGSRLDKGRKAVFGTAATTLVSAAGVTPRCDEHYSTKGRLSLLL